MPQTIKIKRSDTNSLPALSAGEIAVSESDGELGIGLIGGGNAIVGGTKFTNLLDHTAGVLTASSAIITDASNKIDNLKVDNLDLNGNTISSTDTNGNIVLDPNGTGVVDVNTSRITNVTDPTGAQDAATKSYVDSVAQGLDSKDSVRVASDAAIADLSDVTVADFDGTAQGITLVEGDRVLVKDTASADGIEGATAVRNGIYVVGTVTTGTAPLTRAADADTDAEVTAGMYCFVEEGTHADAGFVLTTDDPITVDTTALAFTQFSGAGQITAGAALTKTGNTLDVAVDDVTIEVVTDALQVKADGIDATHIELANNTELVGRNLADSADVGMIKVNASDEVELPNGVTIGSINVTAILDEDNMASDSATALATQQSIKAYVDSVAAGVDSLAELTDTNITTPNDAALLLYDTGTGTWRDADMSGDATISDTGAITLATVTVAKGGTGLTALGTAGQVLAVNDGGTALEYTDIDGGTF